MVTLITPDSISFEARITEDDLRARMEREVLEQINGIDDDGKVRKNLKVRTTRGTGRAGGYTISVSGPAPARIMLPAPKGSD